MTFRKSDWLEDWYLIEDCGTDACVEGTQKEMLAVADAIKEKKDAYFKRCAAIKSNSDRYRFFSPRNSIRSAFQSYEDSFALANQIHRYFNDQIPLQTPPPPTECP